MSYIADTPQTADASEAVAYRVRLRIGRSLPSAVEEYIVIACSFDDAARKAMDREISLLKAELGYESGSAELEEHRRMCRPHSIEVYGAADRIVI